jgi:hypothetical protein
MRTRKQAEAAANAARKVINEAAAQAQQTQQLAEAQGKALDNVKAQIEEYWEDSND